MAHVREIHFYPGSMILVVFDIHQRGRIPLYTIEARGGPAGGGHDPRMQEIPTTAGRFIIGEIKPYRTRTWTWSQIAWGTPLRDDPRLGDVYFLNSGKWVSVKGDLKLSRNDIRQEYFDLWGRLEVPTTWSSTTSARSQFATSRISTITAFAMARSD
jgi:hypothetical protein